MRKAALVTAAITTLAVVAGTASIAAASPAAKPVTVISRTLSLNVRFTAGARRHLVTNPQSHAKMHRQAVPAAGAIITGFNLGGTP